MGVNMLTVRSAAAIGSIVALGAVSATLLASPASADDTWSAIAVSIATKVVGVSYGYPIEGGPDSAAAQRAVQECANHPLHPTDCMWLISAKCVVLEVSEDRFQSGGGRTREEAENTARFPGSSNRAWVCSGPQSAPGGRSTSPSDPYVDLGQG